MNNPHVYDKAKYHHEAVLGEGLPESHASNHTVPILRWLIENDLMSDFFKEEASDQIQSFKAGSKSIHEIYQWWDCCLISDMLSEEGNAFAMFYFDFEQEKYTGDYARILQRDLPSEYHVAYSESNYAQIRPVIDSAYAAWKKEKSSA